MFLVSPYSCLRPIHWSQVLSWEWRCSWSSADRRCSNYIWVINNFIVYKGATYIRGFTVRSVQNTGTCYPSQGLFVRNLGITSATWVTWRVYHGGVQPFVRNLLASTPRLHLTNGLSSLLASLYNPIMNPAMVSTVRFYDRNELYGSPDVRNCRMPNFFKARYGGSNMKKK